MSDPPFPESELIASWNANAEPWTSAVRRGAIPSRRAGTDAAILEACAHALTGIAAPRVLDVGCGEGWLARALSARGADVLGIDASAVLVAHARDAGGAARFEVADYGQLAGDPAVAPGAWDLVVCNFALLAEELAPLLRALAARLATGGALLIQTVHPWTVATAEPPYEDGWRRETWSHVGTHFTAPMPWYFRTLESWVALLRAAGLTVTALREPRHVETGLPLSLLLEARRAS